MQRCGRCAGYVGPWWFHFICYNCGHEPRYQPRRLGAAKGLHAPITLAEYVQGITWAELGYSLGRTAAPGAYCHRVKDFDGPGIRKGITAGELGTGNPSILRNRR